MIRFLVLLFTAGALLVVSTPTAEAQYGYGRRYYVPRPMPQPRMVQPYPYGYPYYRQRGNLGRIPGQTAGPTCVYIRNGVCYFY